MLRKLILKGAESAITLPVTPKEYFVQDGMDTQSVDVHTLGTYTAPTYRKLRQVKLEFSLPSSNRSYCASYQDQTYLLNWLLAAMANKTPLRFLVSGTQVNIPVFIASLTYGEDDGTNDLACTMELMEQRTLSLVTTSSNTVDTSATETRTVEDVQTEETTYTVVSGDTLWGICCQFYGDGSLCYKLASYNNIANAYLIYVGDVLKIPSAETLGAVAVSTTTTASATIAPDYYTFTIRLASVAVGGGLLRASYKNYDTGQWFSGNVGSSTLKVCQGTMASFEILSGGTDTYSTVTVDGVKKTVIGNYFSVWAHGNRVILCS